MFRDLSRRGFLKLSGAMAVSSTVAGAEAAFALPNASTPSATDALERAVKRILGDHAAQIHPRLNPASGAESFRVTGSPGRILVEGSTPSAVMMGVNWYLKYVAGVSVSWNGDSLSRLPALLPAPAAPIERTANAPHRFALNDTNDGYTGPYWQWEQWERFIDVLSLHGFNEALIYMGAEAVYLETFPRFGLADEEMRRWFATPAHQPWWVLQNISHWVGPIVSRQLIDARVRLARRIADRLRELGMTPVFPGYFGMVPDGFRERHPEARIVPQGEFAGMKRPDWLDPASDLFAEVAAEYYRVQERLFGAATMFKMDPLHEGGQLGSINLTAAAASIEAQLQKAHPGAYWALIGWTTNPRRETLAGIKDHSRVLIVDGVSDWNEYEAREKKWDNTPYAFGTIWNYGGKSTLGAPIGLWNKRYFQERLKAGSEMRGIAMMPEAACNNPPALAYFSELAWRPERSDMSAWFAQYAGYRYGGDCENARRAWEILHKTAYDGFDGGGWGSHDNLFSAQPSLTVKTANTWGSKEAGYDIPTFAKAVEYLLKVNPALRSSSAYQYDLVDVARQTISNQSRVLLPRINDAYLAKNLKLYRELTRRYLALITLLNEVTGTNPSFMIGPWIAAARSYGKTPAERDQLEFDARSLLVEWGTRASAEGGDHDYANREWNGLLEFYHERWTLLFSAHEAALEKGEPAREIDWFAVDEAWAKRTNPYRTAPAGDVYEVVDKAMREINSGPDRTEAT